MVIRIMATVIIKSDNYKESVGTINRVDNIIYVARDSVFSTLNKERGEKIKLDMKKKNEKIERERNKKERNKNKKGKLLSERKRKRLICTGSGTR